MSTRVKAKLIEYDYIDGPYEVGQRAKHMTHRAIMIPISGSKSLVIVRPIDHPYPVHFFIMERGFKRGSSFNYHYIPDPFKLVACIRLPERNYKVVKEVEVPRFIVRRLLKTLECMPRIQNLRELCDELLDNVLTEKSVR